MKCCCCLFFFGACHSWFPGELRFLGLAEKGGVLSAFGSSLELCAERDGICIEEEVFPRDGASRARVLGPCSGEMARMSFASGMSAQ